MSTSEMYWKGPGVLNISRDKDVKENGLIPQGALDEVRIKKFKKLGMITDHPAQVVVQGDDAMKQTIFDLRKRVGELTKENGKLKTLAESVPSLNQKIADLNALLEDLKKKAEKELKPGIFENLFGKKDS